MILDFTLKVPKMYLELNSKKNWFFRKEFLTTSLMLPKKLVLPKKFVGEFVRIRSLFYCFQKHDLLLDW